MLNLIVYTRIYRWKEIYREGSDGVEKWNYFVVTFLHVPWNFLITSEKELRFLAECLSSWIVMGRQDDSIQHGENLIIIAVKADNN